MKMKDKIKKILINLRYKEHRSLENIREIEYKELKNLLKTVSNIIILDVRSPKEFSEKKLDYSINIPLYDLEVKVENILKNKESLIVIYCSYGIRSKKAYNILEKKGYTNLYSLKGGIEGVD